MVQVIENRADIEGRVLAVRPDPDRPQHNIVTIVADIIASVGDYPNMFSKSSGSPLAVILPAHLTEHLRPGEIVLCRLRRTSPTTVVGESCRPK
jgi:hypothetical protein